MIFMKRMMVLSITENQTVFRSIVLLASVKCCNIVGIEYRLVAKKHEKMIQGDYKYIKIVFVALANVSYVNGVFNTI